MCVGGVEHGKRGGGPGPGPVDVIFIWFGLAFVGVGVGMDVLLCLCDRLLVCVGLDGRLLACLFLGVGRILDFDRNPLLCVLTTSRVGVGVGSSDCFWGGEGGIEKYDRVMKVGVFELMNEVFVLFSSVCGLV